MGLFDRVQTPTPTPQSSKDNLEKKEIEFILNTIKEANFKGGDLDTLYKVVVKLQNQYVKLDK